jgi:hypothetical protein
MTTPNNVDGQQKREKKLSFRQQFRRTVKAVAKFTPEQHIDAMVRAKLMTPEFGEAEKKRLAARDAANAAAAPPAADPQATIPPPASVP